MLSAGGQAVLEGPGRCFPTLGSSRLLHAISHCPHDISSFSSNMNFFKQLDDGLSEGMLKPPGFLRPKPRTARASLLLHSHWPRQVTSPVQIQSLDGAVGVFRDEVLPGGHLWGLYTTDRVQSFLSYPSSPSHCPTLPRLHSCSQSCEFNHDIMPPSIPSSLNELFFAWITYPCNTNSPRLSPGSPA